MYQFLYKYKYIVYMCIYLYVCTSLWLSGTIGQCNTNVNREFTAAKSSNDAEHKTITTAKYWEEN